MFFSCSAHAAATLTTPSPAVNENMPYARTPSGPNRSNNGKAIAESHLPSLLSASSAFRTLTPPLGLGGRPARNFLDSLRRGRRITPARSNRASRPSGACSSRANTDSRRATGRSRSRIRTVSPCRTASIQCAQVVLRLGYSDSLHAAIIVRRHVGRRRVSGYCDAHLPSYSLPQTTKWKRLDP